MYARTPRLQKSSPYLPLLCAQSKSLCRKPLAFRRQSAKILPVARHGAAESPCSLVWRQSGHHVERDATPDPLDDPAITPSAANQPSTSGLGHLVGRPSGAAVFQNRGHAAKFRCKRNQPQPADPGAPATLVAAMQPRSSHARGESTAGKSNHAHDARKPSQDITRA
jgi:hypothetical protein